MSLDNSPSLDLYRKGIPEKYPDPKRPRRIVWGMIIALMVFAVGIGIFNMWQNGSLALLAGTGTVTGIVFDDQGNPVQADVYIFGTNLAAKSDSTGYFALSGVPAGEQVLVVGYRGIGREFSTTVIAGEEIEVGELRFQPGDFDSGFVYPLEANP